MPTPTLLSDSAERAAACDATVVVAASLAGVASANAAFAQCVDDAAAVDASLPRLVSASTTHPSATCALLRCAAASGERLVVAFTGPLARDYDDVRRVADAARAGVARAKQAGARALRLVVAASSLPAGDAPLAAEYERAPSVAVLGALAELYAFLQARELHGDASAEPVERLVCAVDDAASGSARAQLSDDGVRTLAALECGRRLCRDLGVSDPERMAPARMADACRASFAGVEHASVEVVDDDDTLRSGYPLLAAVARASLAVERHRPCVVRLSYRPPGAQRTLLVAGKGVTYDCGGVDIKVPTSAGMSRDKCGAATAAGIVRAAAALGRTDTAVIAELGCVRNSVGADAYVSDEIIRSRAGVAVSVKNTDAEGRLVLADLLASLRERVLAAPDAHPSPHLMSIATLTGHAVRTVGCYSIALDNGPARASAASSSTALARLSDRWGDPVDVSRVRRDDYEAARSKSADADVMSMPGSAASGAKVMQRGHQYPVAFLAAASRLDEHGRDAERPLRYSHLDIAGSSVENGDMLWGKATASTLVPIVALHVLQEQ